MIDPLRRRPVRSYVLREGRFTNAQRRAFKSLWERYGVDDTGTQRLELVQVFGNARPIYLEIGFGNGESLLHIAGQHRRYNYLGIEVHRPGIGHLLLGLAKTGLENVKVLRHDAVEVLRHNLQPATLAGVYLFFPDPWPKKRHHKRRIVQTEFVTLVARAIKTRGVLHMATDWRDYAEQMMAVLSANGDFINTAGAGRFSPRPDERPMTRFEQRGLRVGHAVYDLIFIRN